MNSYHKKIVGALAIILAATMWGLDGVILTPKLFNLDIGFVVFILHLIPFLLMNLFLFTEYKKIKSFRKNDFLLLFGIAIFGGSLGTMAVVKALSLTQFDHLSVIVLIQKLQPVFAIVLAAVFLNERLKEDFVLWALVAITASYFLTFGRATPNLDKHANLIQAALWSLLAAISFGSATVLGKVALTKFSVKTVAFYRFGFTALLMLFYIIFAGKIGEFKNITIQNWKFSLIIALTTGGSGLFLYYFGLKKVKAMVSSICELSFPLSVILFDFFINKNLLSFFQILGAIMLIIATLEITFHRNRIRVLVPRR